MKKTLALVVGIVLAAGVLLVPAAEAAPPAPRSPSTAVATSGPVPGRFCKTADAGKVVKTSRYGRLKCAMKSGRYHWVRV